MSKSRNALWGAIAFSALSAIPADAATVNVSFTNTGVTVAGSTIFRADLSAIGLGQVGSIKITDLNTGVGGSSGIFSGFDADAVFLDLDGDVTTTGDRINPASFLFQAGTTRPTADPTLLPNGAHPGPTFGSVNATTIQDATATLTTLDGVSIADVNSANGFLTLGDGGSLTAIFSPFVTLGGPLFLLAGEVGGNGEDLAALVTVSDTAPDVPIPGALPLFASGLGALGIAAWRRKRKAAV